MGDVEDSLKIAINQYNSQVKGKWEEHNGSFTKYEFSGIYQILIEPIENKIKKYPEGSSFVKSAKDLYKESKENDPIEPQKISFFEKNLLKIEEAVFQNKIN